MISSYSCSRIRCLTANTGQLADTCAQQSRRWRTNRLCCFTMIAARGLVILIENNAPVQASEYSRAPCLPTFCATLIRSRFFSFVELVDQALLNQPVHDAVVKNLRFVRLRLANHL